MSVVHEPEQATDGDGAMLVSVVVCFLDAGPFLEEAIASVYAQSYGKWELLLVDDGSSDQSTAIALRHASADPGRVRYLKHPGRENKGISASRNLGISRARGEFVSFLDADDVYLPHRLERSVELLNTNSAADMVYGESEYWYNWDDHQGAFENRVQPQGFSANRVVRAPELLTRYLTHQATMPCINSITVRSKAIRECGGFVESFRAMYEDQAFLARFCLTHDVFVARECWDRYRQHGAGVCAEAERRGESNQSRRIYLKWLYQFLEDEGMRGTPVWDALRHAELVERFQRPGYQARIARLALRAYARARIVLRRLEL